MSVFKKKAETVKIQFQCPAELAQRLKKIELAAKEKGFDFDLDEHLAGSLGKLLTAAEKELAGSAPAPAPGAAASMPAPQA